MHNKDRCDLWFSFLECWVLHKKSLWCTQKSCRHSFVFKCVDNFFLNLVTKNWSANKKLKSTYKKPYFYRNGAPYKSLLHVTHLFHILHIVLRCICYFSCDLWLTVRKMSIKAGPFFWRSVVLHYFGKFKKTSGKNIKLWTMHL